MDAPRPARGWTEKLRSARPSTGRRLYSQGTEVESEGSKGGMGNVLLGSHCGQPGGWGQWNRILRAGLQCPCRPPGGGKGGGVEALECSRVAGSSEPGVHTVAERDPKIHVE